MSTIALKRCPFPFEFDASPYRIGVLTIAIALCWASVSPARPDDLRFSHISTEQGLSQGFVYAVHQDAMGFMWFGTRDGLNRYDGYSFLRFTHQPFARETIPTGVVRSVSEDSCGGLWLGTFRGGLVRFDRQTGRFRSFRHNQGDPSSLSADNILCTFIDSRNRLWAGTLHGGLNRLDLSDLYDESGRIRSVTAPRFRRFRYDTADPNGLAGPEVYSICEDRAGRIWFVTSRGLNVLDPTTDRLVRFGRHPDYPASVPWNLAHVVRPDPNGGVWIGTIIGLYRVDERGRSIRRYSEAAQVQALTLDANGTVWFGAFDGLHALDPLTGDERHYRYANAGGGPVHGSEILTLYIDKTGALWIGTNGGIDKVSRGESIFSSGLPGLEAFQGSPGRDVRSLLADRSGLLWIGRAGAGLECVDRATGLVRSYTVGRPVGHNYINTIHQDRGGRIWVGTRSNIRVGSPAGEDGDYRFEHLELPDSIDVNVWAICEDRYGSIWIGSTTGLSRYDPRTGKARVFRHDPSDPTSISFDGAWAIREDRDGVMWIGTPNGLNRFERSTETFRRFRHDPGDRTSLAHNEVWSIFEDARGTLWVGTWGGGLNRFDKRTGTFVHYMESDGLGGNVVQGILQDTADNLWISTGRGLSRFDLRTERFTNYGPDDGLQVREFNPNACTRTADGVMFFGGLGGLTSFRPQEMRTIESRRAPLVITAFSKLDSIFSHELTDGMNVEVLPGENTFSFTFASLDFDDSRHIRYAYMLEGFDEDWVYSGDQRRASYTNLDPGDYVFRVKATNGKGVWREPGIGIGVTVVPPFTATLPFYALVVLAATGTFGVWFRRRRIMRDARERALDQARETERREIAAELHDGPLQDLYSLRFGLDRLKSGASGAAQADDLASIDETLKRVRGSLRTVCGDLQLPSFQGGLDDAIRTHASRFRELYPGPVIDLDLMPEPGVVTNDVRENLFRIYRSAMNNVAKHADASEILIRLVAERNSVLLEIRDNGRGFSLPGNLNALVRQKHYGLLLAEAHARAAGGRLSVTSSPGMGTTVRVEIRTPRSRLRRLFGDTGQRRTGAE